MGNLPGNAITRRDFITRALAGAACFGFGLQGWAADGPVAAPGRKLGIALCGLGEYATNQLGSALRETKHCELRGVVTGDPAKGRRWARGYGFPESSVYGYDTIQKMADNPDIDILYSVTPPALHKRDTVRGFEAGKHVISEKPMAMNAAECDEMLAAARKAGKKLSIGYRLHFHPYYIQLKRMAKGEGKAFTTLSGANGFPYRESGTWRLKREMGGGPMMDLGVYVLYCCAMAKNEAYPSAVNAEELPKTRPEFFSDVEQGMRFTLEYPDGATLEGETSWNDRMNRFEVRADDRFMKLSPCYGYGGLRGRTHEGELPTHPGFNQQAHQMDAFAREIMNDEEPTAAGELGRRDMRIIDAIFESARTGQRVEIRA